MNTRPDHVEFLLASMRTASLNLKSWAAEIDGIGTALRGNLISEETALGWLDELGVLAYLPTDQEQAA